MHWILQDNMFDEAAYADLVAALEQFAIPYSVHKVIPFVGDLLPDPQLNTTNVICIGSYSMRHIAKTKGWSPGVYDLFPHNFNEQLIRWGSHMLNADSHVCEFQHVKFQHDAQFVRPIDDSKYFAGRVFDREEFEEWQKKVVLLEEQTGTSLRADTLVQVCNPKQIYQEIRYWIVDEQIVTRSIYKTGSRVHYDSNVDERFDEFVWERINRVTGWCPECAFVIDVCDTPEGMKIVEINTINSAGFYAGDMQRLVMALEDAGNVNGKR